MDKPYVLIIDDNEATCTLIAAVLRHDFAVESVGDATDAIEKLRTNTYSVILLDLRMPNVDGFAVLDHLKATKPDMLARVLVVTALLRAEEMERARAYGICGIVSKPFEIEPLLEAVKQCAGIDGGRLTNVFCSSTPMILLLADLLRQRLG